MSLFPPMELLGIITRKINYSIALLPRQALSRLVNTVAISSHLHVWRGIKRPNESTTLVAMARIHHHYGHFINHLVIVNPRIEQGINQR